MRKTIEVFLDGNVDEKEFFNIQRDDLVSLRDYLNAMYTMDNKFDYLISGIVGLLRRDLPWLKSVKFDGCQNHKTKEFFLTALYLNSYDGVNLIVSFNKNSEMYLDTCHDRIPTLYMISKKPRIRAKRQHEILKPNVQECLKQIDSAAKYMYDGCLSRKNSASGEFEILYSPDLGMLVLEDRETIATFYHATPKDKRKPYLKDKDKKKLLDMIKMKKTDLPNVDRPTVVLGSMFGNVNDNTLEKVLKSKNGGEKND